MHLKNIRMKKISTCLWFDNQAEEAVKFYTSVFKNSKTGNIRHYDEAGSNASGMPVGTVMTVIFNLEDQEFMALNGGPVFKFTKSTSFMISCNTSVEADELWEKLSEGGEILMKLDKYPFSEKFGWLKDKFGISWQLNFTESPQKITPFLWYSNQAEEAIRFYTSVFRKSRIFRIEHFEKDGRGPEGKVMHAAFMLEGQQFMAMDSNNEPFTPAFSFMINCDTQEELDHYWYKLSEEGDENAQQCGWLIDKFGVSWQIIPSVLNKMLLDKDPEKSIRVMNAVLKMKKLDIETLKKAYAG